MDEKYPELVSFYRDNENQDQLQKAIHEYQYFAKVFKQIEYTLTFSPEKLEPQVKDKLDNKDL